ncbi:MAG: DUF3536 domain-containing protein [Cyanobacteria bacterium P01_E01_bin.34]
MYSSSQPAGGSLAFLGVANEQSQITPANQTVYVTIHGHFYQPPRENPYLDDIEPQPSAAPYQNWNERILAECYRPNAFARILDDRGRVIEIVNNYDYLSFNFGPTLLSWLERHDVEVYQRILAADRTSAHRLNGHGNAIAQVYNHIILPLASERDKTTQIRWGIADFMHRFQRRPEGMWLAEAAIDLPTVVALVNEGIRFTVLAPSQAQRCRSLSSESEDWVDVGNGQIDPTRPYRCYVPESYGLDEYGQRRYLDIFFYDGPVSGDIGFNDVVDSSQNLVGRLKQCLQNTDGSQLIHCATDGETFGHHKANKERTIAYAFTRDFPEQGFTVTNYAHYLSLNPPEWEVELKPVSAWSCPHGVGRWERDCGCASESGLHQQWRAPLRNALNWLRDRLAQVFETRASVYLRDPWAARNAYVSVILNRTPETIERFFQEQRRREMSPVEEIDCLHLLEMQRHGQLMFTSCGWFFEELSRPEGVQILRYASRAIELVAEVSGQNLEPEFLERLTEARSNYTDLHANGAEVYRKHVLPSVVTPERVAAHYAIKSLFNPYPRSSKVYSYTVEQPHPDSIQRSTYGGDTLSVGRIQVKSDITLNSHDLMYGVLHLGGWDFHCCVQPFPGQRRFEHIQQHLLGCLEHRAQAAIAMQELFGREYYSLDDLMASDRHEIMRMLTQSTLGQLNRFYRKIYQDNYRVLLAFRRDGLQIPMELQAAVNMTLNQRLTTLIQAFESELSSSPRTLQELQQLMQEARELGCELQLDEATATLNRMLHQQFWHVLNASELDTIAQPLPAIHRCLDVVDLLKLPIDRDRVQENYLGCLGKHLTASARSGASVPLSDLTDLGERLKINVASCLEYRAAHA